MQFDVNDKREALESLVARILDESRKQGASSAEVSASQDLGLSVAARNRDVETIEFNQDRGFGITVYFDGRKGSASTSDASAEAIEQTVRAACNVARFTEADEYAGLASAEELATGAIDLGLHHPREVAPEEAIAAAVACESAALDADDRVSRSDGASFSSHSTIRTYGNSAGFLGSHWGTRYGMSCMAIAEEAQADGMQRDYWYTVARSYDDLETPEAVGARAASRAVARLAPRKAPTGRYPVLFSTDVSGGLLGHLIGALSGGALYRQASFLLDSMGEQVMPEAYSVREVPHLSGAIGSASFDGDGVATREQAFVADGKVASYVLSCYSARRLGLSTTGNASGVHNLELQGPTAAESELLKQMDRGFLVKEMMGQGVNMVTGDYSRGAAGFWVENGEIAYPVDEVTIAENLRNMLMSIVGIGDQPDLRGNVRAPAILLEGMTIAGE